MILKFNERLHVIAFRRVFALLLRGVLNLVGKKQKEFVFIEWLFQDGF